MSCSLWLLSPRRWIFYNRTDRVRSFRYPPVQMFKLKYWVHIEHPLSDLGCWVFDRLETRVQRYPNTQNPSNIIINLLDPPLLEIPQDCVTGSTHTRIQETVGDPDPSWDDKIMSVVGHIDEIHVLSVVRSAPIVGYSSPPQICDVCALLHPRKLDMEMSPDTLQVKSSWQSQEGCLFLGVFKRLVRLPCLVRFPISQGDFFKVSKFISIRIKKVEIRGMVMSR